MKKLSTDLRLLGNTFLFVFVLSLGADLHAQVNHDGLSDLGLVVQWEANIGGAPPVHGRSSVVLWPHLSAKREHVTVRIGNRLIAKINGDEIDTVALEKAVVRGENVGNSPRLGLKGAEERAKKLVATYKTLGRTATYEPFSQNVTYLVTLASNGILQVADAESGDVIWQVEAGDARLPMFGPGVSDEHVVITNGNYLQIYSLASGNQINTRKLDFSPTGPPRAIAGKAVVPSIDGRAVVYDIEDFKVAPTVLRTGKENRLGTTLTADRKFMAWPSASKLILSKIEVRPLLWSSVTFGETMATLPVAAPNGLVGCTMQGTVFMCNSQQFDGVLWKHRLAVQVAKSPVVGNGLAVVVSDDGSMFALKLSDGSLAWEFPAQNINEVLTIGKKHVYARNTSGKLAAFDIATGAEIARSNILLTDLLPNSVNDRVLIISDSGQLSYLREIESVEPTLVAPWTAEDNNKAKAVETDDASPKSTGESDVFEGAGDNDTMEDDPFGTP